LTWGDVPMKTFLVYSHLLSACFAIGILIMQDIALAKIQGRSMNAREIAELKYNSGMVSLALILLWVTGAGLVAQGYLNDAAYILNQKLWAKVVVVVTLTLNGVILHHYSFPKLMAKQGFWSNTTPQQLVVMATAVISVVSWLFACYLGIARTWNNTVSLAYVMSFYAAALAVGTGIALEVWRAMRKPQAVTIKS
jgi:protein-S-isoprenylcysteine O-methyltransferase Ste14